MRAFLLNFDNEEDSKINENIDESVESIQKPP